MMLSIYSVKSCNSASNCIILRYSGCLVTFFHLENMGKWLTCKLFERILLTQLKIKYDIGSRLFGMWVKSFLLTRKV